jgi:hypothetical protein
MEELKITPTRNTPEIKLNPDGIFKIRGRSISPNVLGFFAPVDNWITEYIKTPAEVTCVDMNLEYFNSGSAKMLMNILQKITHVTLKNKKFIFNWYFEEGDDDILEHGEYFASALDVPFNFIKIR